MNKIFKKEGFTLIEILIVLAIVGLLATLTMTAVNRAREKAKIAKAKHDIDAIYSAIFAMANDTNAWPGHQPNGELCTSGCPGKIICGPDRNGATCTATLSSPSSGLSVSDGAFSGWNGPYMYKVPQDAWGHEYFFSTSYMVKNSDNTPCDGTEPLCHATVVVGSYGPDFLAHPTGTGAGVFGEDDIIKIIK